MATPVLLGHGIRSITRRYGRVLGVSSPTRVFQQRLCLDSKRLLSTTTTSSSSTRTTVPRVYQIIRSEMKQSQQNNAQDGNGTAYYDSHGDYQADDASGSFFQSDSLPLYEAQDSLPRLPVNSLEDTLDKLRASCLALTDDETERSNFLKACDSFPEEARELQEGLEARARSEENWLQSWWNRYGYLRVRDPSPINVNYVFSFPRQPASGIRSPLRRGAVALHGAYEYSERVRSGSLPQGRVGKQQTPLCSSMYKYMFYACRIPKPNQDVYRVYRTRFSRFYDPHRDRPPHAVVSAGGHYFSVPLLDPANGRPYGMDELEGALHECLGRASELSGNDDVVRNLGLLTASHRDEWASNRAELIDSIGGMRDALHQLESGLILLCLDEGFGGDNNNNNNDGAPTVTIDSQSQNSRSYLMGTEGRWYDKSIQLILTPNGNLGLNGEHSMMDGMPVVGLYDYLVEQEAKASHNTENKSSSFAAEASPTVTPIFAPLVESMDDSQRETLRAMTQKALRDFDAVRTSVDLEVQSFRGYGATWIKKHGRCSPDAYVQMAIQLAMGKLSTLAGGNPRCYQPLATYESTQVRPFRYGRTETTRSVSAQSVAFVRAMLSRHRTTETSAATLRALFHEATGAHVNYIRQASRGHGVDRHLFGLQMVLAEKQQQQGTENTAQGGTPSLFADPLFLRSKQWLVSTSTVPANPGFGPVVVPEGVGIAYELRDDHVYFTCTSYQASAPALSHYLEESLLELRELLLLETDQGTSKL